MGQIRYRVSDTPESDIFFLSDLSYFAARVNVKEPQAQNIMLVMSNGPRRRRIRIKSVSCMDNT